MPGSAPEVTLRGASRRALLTSSSPSFVVSWTRLRPVEIAVSEPKHQPLPHAASAGFPGKRRVFASSRHWCLRLQPLLAAMPTPRLHQW